MFAASDSTRENTNTQISHSFNKQLSLSNKTQAFLHEIERTNSKINKKEKKDLSFVEEVNNQDEQSKLFDSSNLPPIK